MFLVAVLATGLCGCPPLNHKIFIRNTTVDTAHLTLFYNESNTMSNRGITVKSRNEVLTINKKTLSQLNESLVAFAENGKIVLGLQIILTKN
jgi:hypothetical protein